MATSEASAGVRPNQSPYQFSQQVELMSTMVSSKTERTLWRAFGGVSWLLVSVGTFLVAFGYLGVIDSAFSYYEDPLDNFRMIGYGIVAYAIAAIFVAMNRFVKSH